MIRCVGGIQDVPVLHGKHTKMSNTYEVEAFMLPAEYLKQKVAWKTSKSFLGYHNARMGILLHCIQVYCAIIYVNNCPFQYRW